MTRLTFEEFWAGFKVLHPEARPYAKAAWDACEAALRAEQSEAVALAVAGAYLDAAERVSQYTVNDILARTPADAKAALERRDAEKDATIKQYRDAMFDSALQCGFGARSEDPLSWMVATIERLQAEKDDSESLLASTTDLLNTWAREWSVPEAHDEKGIKGVVERLWSKCSTVRFGLQAELADAKRVRIGKTNPPPEINLDDEGIDAAKGGSQP